LELCVSANTRKVGAESYLCQYDLNESIISEEPTQSGPSPRSGKLDSLGRAARGGSGLGRAGDDACTGGARRSRGGVTRGVTRAGAGARAGVLSSNEGGGEGEDGESGEAKHGVGCRV
jgi:hypothetical protein